MTKKNKGIVQRLHNIVYKDVIFKHFEVEDACFIEEKPFHVFSWKKGTLDAPHYKSYAYTIKDKDYSEENVLITAEGIDQYSLEGAGIEAVEYVFENTLLDYHLKEILKLNKKYIK